MNSDELITLWLNSNLSMPRDRAILNGPVFILEDIDSSNVPVYLVERSGAKLNPTQDELEEWRSIFEAAKDDPDLHFKVHPGISIKKYRSK